MTAVVEGACLPSAVAVAWGLACLLHGSTSQSHEEASGKTASIVAAVWFHWVSLDVPAGFQPISGTWKWYLYIPCHKCIITNPDELDSTITIGKIKVNK